MSRPRNKFERREANRRRLERLYNNGINCGYPTGIEFYAEEPDYRYENTNYRYYRGPVPQDDGTYKYWKRPSGKYYIRERHYYRPHAGRESLKKFYKKVSSKRVRRSKGLYQRGQYKKVFDLWWTLW